MGRSARRSTALVRATPYRAPQTIVVRTRSAGKPKKKHHRRGRGGASLQKTVMASGIGGAVLGFIDKQFPNLPTVPMLGRAGTIGVIAYVMAGKGGGGGLGMGGIARDVAIAAAAVAGYELGKEGKVSGVASQVYGVASQV